MGTPITTTTVQKSITLYPGDQFVLPSGATITSVISSGGASASADCDLPDPSEYVCSYFKITMADDSVSGEPMDNFSLKMGILKVGDAASFDFNDQVVYGSSLVSVNTLNSYITDQGLFKFTKTTATFPSGGERKIIYLYFQTVSSFLSSIELQLLDLTNPVYFKAGTVAIECGEYPNP